MTSLSCITSTMWEDNNSIARQCSGHIKVLPSNNHRHSSMKYCHPKRFQSKMLCTRDSVRKHESQNARGSWSPKFQAFLVYTAKTGDESAAARVIMR